MLVKKWLPTLIIVIAVIFLLVQCQANQVEQTPDTQPNILPVAKGTITELPPLPDWATQSLPDFTAHRDVKEKKVAFFNFLFPRIVLANSRLLLERHNLAIIMNETELNPEELAWLKKQSARLKIAGEIDVAEKILRLNRRLDIIPPSLVMAQAANESGWGTSRFAREGNNLFGQWCFSEGCGLVPKNRGQDKYHEVAKFHSPYFSVRSFMQNLNRHPRYKLLRDLRTEIHAKGAYSKGSDIVEGLLGYSERGQVYIDEIEQLMTFNKLDTYDLRLQRLFADQTQSSLLALATAASPDDYWATKTTQTVPSE